MTQTPKYSFGKFLSSLLSTDISRSVFGSNYKKRYSIKYKSNPQVILYSNGIVASRFNHRSITDFNFTEICVLYIILVISSLFNSFSQLWMLLSESIDIIMPVISSLRYFKTSTVFEQTFFVISTSVSLWEKPKEARKVDKSIDSKDLPE